MTVKTASGAKFYIGSAVSDLGMNQSALAALTYTEVKSIESFGEFGDTASLVSFESVGDARVISSKGSRDAGNMAIVCGREPGDVGQIALSAAQKTNFNYAVKVVLNDAVTPTTGTPTTFYLIGLIMSEPNNVGNNNNMVRRTFNFKLNATPIEVPAT